MKTKPEDYVEVLLSAVLRYFWRAQDSAKKLPENQQLAFLRTQDLAERTEWITRFRAGSDSLGAVISAVYAASSAHWDVSIPRGISAQGEPKRGFTRALARLSHPPSGSLRENLCRQLYIVLLCLPVR